MSHHRRRAAGGASYTPNCVYFDGADYLAKTSFSAPAGSGLFTISFWFRAGADGTGMRLFEAHDGTNYIIRITRNNTDNKIRIIARTGTLTTLLDVTTSSTFTVAGGWKHVVLSVDLSNTSKRFIYVNGVADTPTWSTYSSGNIKHSATNRNVMAAFGGGSPTTGDAADFMTWAAYVDLSVAANLQKFYNGGPVKTSKAVTLMGTPDIRLANPVASWHTNLGSGGGFTLTGTLDASSSTP